VKVTLSGEDVQIKKSGKIIINAAKFSSIIKNFPDGDVSVIADDNFSVVISGSRSEFSVHGLDGETFPLMPELEGEKGFKISRKVLKNMIVATLFAVAVNNPRPSLNGALFEIKGSGLNIIAIDGFRIALRRSFDGIITDGAESESGFEPESESENEMQFIVPGRSLSELLKLIDDEEENAEIQLTRKHVIVSFDNIIFFSRLIESEFFDYKRLIKTDPKTTVVIDTRNFIESVERAAILAEDKQKSKIKLNFVKGEVNLENSGDFGVMQVTSATSFGRTSDECDIEIQGDDLEIGFNHRYLLDALKAAREEKIMLKLESATKSMIILPYNTEGDSSGSSADPVKGVDAESSKFLYLVLPVRLRD
jgi:DNA polymerase-3 subunit beta